MKQNTTDLVPTLQKEASTLVKQATAFTITSQLDMEQATTHLSTINLRLDTIDAERTKVTAPLDQALKAERARWKPIETELEEARDIIRKTMSEYQTTLKAVADKKASEIAARIKPGKGNLSPETGVSKIAELDTPQQEVVTEVGSVQFRTRPNVEITPLKDIDFGNMNDDVFTNTIHQAMLDNLIVWNEPEVRRIVKLHKDSTILPGVRYYETQEPYNSR